MKTQEEKCRKDGVYYFNFFNVDLLLKGTHYVSPTERVAELTAMWVNLVECQHLELSQQPEFNLFGRKIEKALGMEKDGQE